ncbi:HNH endonuclease signature motif containing protein [Rhodococcus sp. ABRD24]|uniref:HNH endonuclease signature motif containing protein n=1 Tax=Rhodococcus sp. ABRD24 TaxID=2507582 RepID=UPI001F61CEFD|nr:HNH endonuclease signature motif containing protein [Rhodococcus sp. ABRD24]
MHARIAREQFLEVDAVTDLFEARCAEDRRAGRNESREGEFAHVEVAGILGLTEWAAQRMIGLGYELRVRLHRVREEFKSGRIDLAKAHAFNEVLANVADELLDAVEERLLEGADRVSTTKLKARARRLIANLDPDGVAERRTTAEAGRDVRVLARDDGLTDLDGILAAVGGRIVSGRLRAMSQNVCGQDPRTMAQRRADALVALASGHTCLDCACGRADCTARQVGKMTANVQVQILVGVSAATLLGFDDAPGFLFGHGPIDADLVRDLAADGTWKQVLTISDKDRERLTANPTAGTPGAVAGIGRAGPAPMLPPTRAAARYRETTYTPSDALAATIRVRDGVCRFPNCTVPAAACDLDHTVPFDHDSPGAGGLTVENNLACLCRKHHRLKTIGYWSVCQSEGGRLDWTDPAGHTITTRPEGPFTLDGLYAGVPEHVRARLDTRTLAKLNRSPVEQELGLLIDLHVPPAQQAAYRQSRRRGYLPRHPDKRREPVLVVDFGEDDPPF